MADSLRQSIRDYFTEIVRLEESLECLRRVMKEKDRDDYLDVFNEIRANNDEIGLQRENFVSFFRNNGVRYAGDSLDLLFKYYNLNNCDEAKIYFTDLKIMLSPNESILSSEVLDQTMAKELAKIDPSMTDLLCSYLEKEICFYSYVRRASENLEHFKYDEIWESISKTSYLDEYDFKKVMNKQQLTSTGIDWKLFCRRIINNPRQIVIHITKNELKIFSKLFVNSIRMANSSHAGQSSSHGGVKMVGIPIPASQILKNLKQNHMKQSSKSLIEKPKSAQMGSPEDKVIKLVVNYQSVPHNYALKPPTPKTSPQIILKKEIIVEPAYREEKFDDKDMRDDHLLDSPAGREDSDYIKIDIKDICPPSRTSSSCRISAKYSQKKERNDDFDDAVDLSVDSEDPKYIFEDDFEDASFRAIDTKDERDQCHSENSKNQSRDKDMHDKDIKLDMDNLRLKYDYDSKLPAIDDGIHGDQDAIYKMSGIDRVRSLGGHITSPENYVENIEKTDDRECEESERSNLSKGPGSSGI